MTIVKNNCIISDSHYPWFIFLLINQKLLHNFIVINGLNLFTTSLSVDKSFSNPNDCRIPKWEILELIHRGKKYGMAKDIWHYAPIGNGTFTLQANKHACTSFFATNAMQTMWLLLNLFLYTQRGWEIIPANKPHSWVWCELYCYSFQWKMFLTWKVILQLQR